MGQTRNSSSAVKSVSVISGNAVTAGLRSSSPIDLVTCQEETLLFINYIFFSVNFFYKTTTVLKHHLISINRIRNDFDAINRTDKSVDDFQNKQICLGVGSRD